MQEEGGRAISGAVEALGTAFRARAADDGSFEILLPPGTWILRASRLGYRPDTVEVVVADGRPPTRIAFRLHYAPIPLAGLTVEGVRRPAFAQTVTPETVRQVPPIGEPDIFRATVLLPGVSQPNDLKGRIHLAGGASDETGVRLDGHPLQDPFHLLGVSGAFNIAALEQADVLIHHLPPSEGGRLSGLVDMRTRSASPDSHREAVAGLLSAGATWGTDHEPSGLDLLMSGRITYLDKVVGFLAPGGTFRGEEIPLVGYRDALVRLGRDWRSWRVEAVGFHTRDNLRAAISATSSPPPLAWGESLAGIKAQHDAGTWGLSVRGSFNRAGVRTDNAVTATPSVSTTRDWISGAVAVNGKYRGATGEAGMSIDSRTHSDTWRTAGLSRQLFSPRTPSDYDGRASQVEYAAFGEVQSEPIEGVSVSAGARMTWVAGRGYLAPRFLAVFSPAERFRVEAAVNRRFQFDAELEEPIEGNILPPRFLLDVPRMADVAALAADWRVSTERGWTGTLRGSVFTKRYTDRPVLREISSPESTPGPFPDFERVRGASHGLSISGQWSRRDTWVFQGSYTFQRALERLDERWYPTVWDAPHDASLFMSVRALGAWHLNAVYRAHSGRATTPVSARVFVSYEEFENYLRTRYLRGERNSVRVPAYQRLDVGARRSWQARGAEWTLFAQVLNVLWNDNPIDYDWFQYFASYSDPSATRYSRRGLPLLPTVGMEVRW